jgi:CheY-like chemotaxis protein
MKKDKICLLIDDDAEDHEIFLIAMQAVDPAVICHIEKDAVTALAKLTNRILLPDFIFVDMNMPRMGGKEFIIEMRTLEHLKDCRLIAYSTSSIEKDMLISLGASHFIEKACNIPKLEEALQACFGSDHLRGSVGCN